MRVYQSRTSSSVNILYHLVINQCIDLIKETLLCGIECLKFSLFSSDNHKDYECCPNYYKVNDTCTGNTLDSFMSFNYIYYIIYVIFYIIALC